MSLNFGSRAIRDLVTALPFGVGYATGTKIGFEGVGEWLFPSSRNSYNYKQPTNFKLPYYRFRRYSRYSRRYSRFRRRPRFFRRYRTRRFY